MSSRKGFLSKMSSMFASSSSTDLEAEGELELDEAEVLNWNMSNEKNDSVGELKKRPRPGKKKGSKKVEGGGKVNPMASSSMPVKIPDWSMILKEDFEEKKKKNRDDDDDYDNHGGEPVPPHEYLARTREASHSVHEGKGRTLKGRDLRSVRNAIWMKLGFED